jgi:hypothetical protein
MLSLGRQKIIIRGAKGTSTFDRNPLSSPPPIRIFMLCENQARVYIYIFHSHARLPDIGEDSHSNNQSNERTFFYLCCQWQPNITCL